MKKELTSSNRFRGDTWVKIAFASDIFNLIDIAGAAKLSAIETTTYPANTSAR